MKLLSAAFINPPAAAEDFNTVALTCRINRLSSTRWWFSVCCYWYCLWIWAQTDSWWHICLVEVWPARQPGTASLGRCQTDEPVIVFGLMAGRAFTGVLHTGWLWIVSGFGLNSQSELVGCSDQDETLPATALEKIFKQGGSSPGVESNHVFPFCYFIRRLHWSLQV